MSSAWGKRMSSAWGKRADSDNDELYNYLLRELHHQARLNKFEHPRYSTDNDGKQSIEGRTDSQETICSSSKSFRFWTIFSSACRIEFGWWSCRCLAKHVLKNEKTQDHQLKHFSYFCIFFAFLVFWNFYRIQWRKNKTTDTKSFDVLDASKIFFFNYSMSFSRAALGQWRRREGEYHRCRPSERTTYYIDDQFCLIKLQTDSNNGWRSNKFPVQIEYLLYKKERR